MSEVESDAHHTRTPLVIAATMLSSAAVGFFGPLSTSLSRPAVFVSPFALAESFPVGSLTTTRTQSALPAVPIQVELSAASVAPISHVAHEFATAAADLGVMLSHSRVHGATAVRLTVWGSKRALQLFVSRCLCANIMAESASSGGVVVTWRRYR